MRGLVKAFDPVLMAAAANLIANVVSPGIRICVCEGRALRGSLGWTRPGIRLGNSTLARSFDRQKEQNRSQFLLDLLLAGEGRAHDDILLVISTSAGLPRS